MTDDNYIAQNRTDRFRKGDSITMHTCAESRLPKYKDKVLVCQTDSFLCKGGDEVVFIEGVSGYFLTKYLKCN